jgi:hypothetical protein
MSSTTESPESATTQTRDRHRTLRELPGRLAIELVIGLGLAAVIMLVAWTSSSAIRFVYGGY